MCDMEPDQKMWWEAYCAAIAAGHAADICEMMADIAIESYNAKFNPPSAASRIR